MADSPRLEELRRRVQSDPASIAFAALAEEYRRAGKFREAVDASRAGLRYHPTYVSARVTLGRSLMELQEAEQAERELTFVLKSAPDNLAARRALGELCWQQLRFADALAHFRTAQTLAPADTELPNILQSLERELAADRSAAASNGNAADAHATDACAPARQPEPEPKPEIKQVAEIAEIKEIKAEPIKPAESIEPAGPIKSAESIEPATPIAAAEPITREPVEETPSEQVIPFTRPQLVLLAPAQTELPDAAPAVAAAADEPTPEPDHKADEAIAFTPTASEDTAFVADTAPAAIEAEGLDAATDDDDADSVAFVDDTFEPEERPSANTANDVTVPDVTPIAAQQALASLNGHTHRPNNVLAALERFHRAILNERNRRRETDHVPASQTPDPPVHRA